ncbi:MAG: glycosyltransferase family 4 protein [Nanoarchaeota archaeon]|nr:glycosyltransferase family 4 protein [Nanoarchaeota archaeon]
MRKMLIATDGFLPRWDGIASFLNQVIPRLEDEFELSIIAPNLGEMTTKYKAEITRFNTARIRLADNYYASLPNPFVMAKKIASTDIVWVQCLGPIGVFGIILSKLKRKKVVLYLHMIEWEVFPQSQGIDLLKVPLNTLTKALSIMLYRMCDLIIVPSSEHVELMNMAHVRCDKRIVHLGVDAEKYKPSHSKEASKRNLGINPGSFVIGYAGRVSLEKDLKTLYRAYLRVCKKHKDTVLLIAGGGRPELEKMFANKPNIILTGLKDNLAPFYQAMDAYVLPSLTETTSLTTMEAMATGVAVVATPVGFVKEYINEGTNGLLFPKKNSFALYQQLEFLIENPEARVKLGENARKTILENYTWDKTADKLRYIFSSVLGESLPHP